MMDRLGGDFRYSLSVSPFIEKMLENGARYKDETDIFACDMESVQRLFMRHGSTEVFARIATAKKYYGSSSNHSLEAAVKRAKLSAKLGLPLNPEINPFHYYGDIGGQPGPDFSEYPEISLSGRWHDISLAEMEEALYKFAAIVANALLETGARVNVWDIGNEINFGFAGIGLSPKPGDFEAEHGAGWYKPAVNIDPVLADFNPDDYEAGFADIGFLQKHVWPYEASLLNAIAEGIRSICINAVIATHIATVPFSIEFASAFYQAMLDFGFSPQIAGLSFYPSNPMGPEDRLGLLFDISDALCDMGFEVFIAEYAYPAGYGADGFFAEGWNHVSTGYPLSPNGQKDMLRDLCFKGREHGICGVRPWAPDLVSPGWLQGSFFSLDEETKTAEARPVINALMSTG